MMRPAWGKLFVRGAGRPFIIQSIGRRKGTENPFQSKQISGMWHEEQTSRGHPRAELCHLLPLPLRIAFLLQLPSVL